MEKCDRPKTNSITHLVKIVADEVFEGKFSEYSIWNRVDQRIKAFVRHPKHIEDIAELVLKNLAGNLPKVPPGKRSGDYWSDKEDNYLRLLFNEFCNRTAEEFKRSAGAIEARISQKLLR